MAGEPSRVAHPHPPPPVLPPSGVGPDEPASGFVVFPPTHWLF